MRRAIAPKSSPQAAQPLSANRAAVSVARRPAAAAVDLTPLLQKKLPSIFLCYLDRIEQLVYLPCGEPAQWRQGLLLINPQANLLGRVTQQKEYIAALYRQLLADHYRNQQNFLF